MQPRIKTKQILFLSINCITMFYYDDCPIIKIQNNYNYDNIVILILSSNIRSKLK